MRVKTFSARYNSMQMALGYYDKLPEGQTNFGYIRHRYPCGGGDPCGGKVLEDRAPGSAWVDASYDVAVGLGSVRRMTSAWVGRLHPSRSRGLHWHHHFDHVA